MKYHSPEKSRKSLGLDLENFKNLVWLSSLLPTEFLFSIDKKC